MDAAPAVPLRQNNDVITEGRGRESTANNRVAWEACSAASIMDVMHLLSQGRVQG